MNCFKIFVLLIFFHASCGANPAEERIAFEQIKDKAAGSNRFYVLFLPPRDAGKDDLTLGYLGDINWLDLERVSIAYKEDDRLVLDELILDNQETMKRLYESSDELKDFSAKVSPQNELFFFSSSVRSLSLIFKLNCNIDVDIVSEENRMRAFIQSGVVRLSNQELCEDVWPTIFAASGTRLILQDSARKFVEGSLLVIRE